MPEKADPIAVGRKPRFRSEQMTKRFKAQAFRANDLRLVAPAPPADDPPLRFGEWCMLNSGSHPLLVVDVDGDAVVVAIRNGEEQKMPRACVRRWLTRFIR